MPPPRRPDPEPLETDDVAIITVGTGLWFVALVLSLIFHSRLEASGDASWVWILLTGGCLGLAGLVYLRRRAQQRTRPLGPGSGADPDAAVFREDKDHA
jgi:hypothetical protein